MRGKISTHTHTPICLWTTSWPRKHDIKRSKPSLFFLSKYFLFMLFNIIEKHVNDVKGCAPVYMRASKVKSNNQTQKALPAWCDGFWLTLCFSLAGKMAKRVGSDFRYVRLFSAWWKWWLFHSHLVSACSLWSHFCKVNNKWTYCTFGYVHRFKCVTPQWTDTNLFYLRVR